MRARISILAAFIATANVTAATAGSGVSLEWGKRFLDESTWHPIDNQETQGLRFNYARPGWPVGLAVAWHFSEGEKTVEEFVPDGGGGCILFFCYRTGDTVERTLARGSLRELSLGMAKDWVSGGSRARGFVGGGVALVRASIGSGAEGFSDRDRSAGFWAHAGVVGRARLDQGGVFLEAGAEIRALQGTRLELGGERGNADYVQVALISGIGW